MPTELDNIVALLESFLGQSKGGLTSSFQIQFNCPKCAEDKGIESDGKYNLELSLVRQKYNCWSCGPIHDESHGSILKLIKIFGNDRILEEYKKEIYSIRQSKLYELTFKNNEFNIDINSFAQFELELPDSFRRFDEHKRNPKKALDYLFNRGITWGIINDFKMGYTLFDNNDRNESTRIVIPSYNEFDELNYYTGRDYSDLKGRQKYLNPKIERKDIIFNENKIQWDSDVTLVEGPFDHIVIPNSIPLLGKALKEDFKLYCNLMEKCNANINIFLDGDAFETVKTIYKTLNHSRMYNKIRFIPINSELDPSLLFQLGGNKAVLEHLANAKQIKEIYLQ